MARLSLKPEEFRILVRDTWRCINENEHLQYLAMDDGVMGEFDARVNWYHRLADLAEIDNRSIEVEDDDFQHFFRFFFYSYDKPPFVEESNDD